MSYPEDKTTIEFQFQVTVSVDAAKGVNLNFLQRRIQEQLEQPSLDDLVRISASDGQVSNKTISAEYGGMVLGHHVPRAITTDEIADAEEEEIEAERRRVAEDGPGWSPADATVSLPPASSFAR